MEEVTRQSIQDICDFHHKRILSATDLKEISEATSDYVKAMDLLVKYDSLVDTHDENVEKIMNSQINDENRREDDLKNEDRKFQHEKRKLVVEIGLALAKIGLLIVVLRWSIRFDGQGVIFTSNAGKSMISSSLRKLWDFLKI